LERIVARCLRKDPGRRFQHMEDLRIALEEVKEESEAGRLVNGAPAATDTGGLRQAPRWVWLAGALAVCGLISVLVWRFTGLAGNRLLPANVDTVQVTTTPGLAIGASFSPDGERIAFSSNRSGWFEIYVRTIGPRGTEQQVTTNGDQNTEPAWSPDGKSIAYHSVARHGIWITSVEGGAPRQVAPFGSSPSWSPDGRQLAFRSNEPSSLAASDWPGDGESTIWTVAADGSQLQQITTPGNPAGQHADPSWSPDGKHVIFASLGIITMGFRGRGVRHAAAGGARTDLGGSQPGIRAGRQGGILCRPA
jgi:Tol biopolymer transport system component